MLSDEEITRVATEVIQGEGDPASVSVAARSDQDFDGTDIIRVTAHYRRRPRGQAYRGLDAMHDIRSALLARGEGRFVFLHNVYGDRADPEVDDAA